MENLKYFQTFIDKDYRSQIASHHSKGYKVPARKDLEPTPFILPYDWAAAEVSDLNWHFQLHALRMLDPFLNAISEGFDVVENFSYVISVVSDWYEFISKETPPKFAWYDMSVGIRASKIAYISHFLNNKALDLGLHLPTYWEGMVDSHIAELSDPSKLNPGNHGLFQLYGLAALTWAHPKANNSNAAASYSALEMGRLIKNQLGDFGVHSEASPAYHFFALNRIKGMLDSPFWHKDFIGAGSGTIEAARKASPWLVDPVNKIYPVGDSDPSLMKMDSYASLEGRCCVTYA